MEKALGLEEARDVMEASNAANFTADSSALLFSYIESEVSLCSKFTFRFTLCIQIMWGTVV